MQSIRNIYNINLLYESSVRISIMSKPLPTPEITVVMPIYNCAPFLEEALASLLIQTYDNFEVLAINDGSTDNSLEILNKFAAYDSRIRIISQKNKGIVDVLNRGVKEARGEYIARMDGDDVCFSNRFADQVAILNTQPNVILVAGDFEVINHRSEFLYRELVFPENDALQRALYLRNPIAHGSTMFRKSAINTVGGYRDLFGPTEDLDLWMRLSRVGEFAATGTSVYKWRMNQNGLTLSNNKESIRQGAVHIERRWKEIEPTTLSRQELIDICHHYLITYKDKGVHYKYDYLTDTSQLAARLFKHGHTSKGLKQLIVVASTGRVGIGIALKRISLIINGRLQS